MLLLSLSVAVLMAGLVSSTAPTQCCFGEVYTAETEGTWNNHPYNSLKGSLDFTRKKFSGIIDFGNNAKLDFYVDYRPTVLRKYTKWYGASKCEYETVRKLMPRCTPAGSALGNFASQGKQFIMFEFQWPNVNPTHRLTRLFTFDENNNCFPLASKSENLPGHSGDTFDHFYIENSYNLSGVYDKSYLASEGCTPKP